MKPTEISIETTHSCGMNCIMCSSRSEYITPTYNEMNTKEIIELIFEGKTMGCECISWSGGDPILRSDYPFLVDIANKLGLKQILYTTGMKYNGKDHYPLSDIELAFLKSLSVKMIFDLQGSKSSIHNKIFRREVFDDMINVIENSIKKGIDVETHFVPQKKNWKDLENYLYFCQELGIKRVSLLRCVPQGRSKEYFDEVMLNQKEFKELQFKIYELIRRNDLKIDIRLGHPIDFQFLCAYEYSDLDKENGMVGDIKIKPCRGGVDAPLIKPNGDVDVCPAWKDLEHFKAGNIREKSLSSIWEKSDIYKSFRWFIHKDGWKYVENDCKYCEFLPFCRTKCIAQRLIISKTLNIKDALIYAPKDPMCWYEP